MNSLFSTSMDPELVRPMDDEESMMLLKLLFLDKQGAFTARLAADLFKPPSLPQPPGIVQIMVGRLMLAEPTLEYQEGVILMLAHVSDGRPGNAVMWAHSLVTKTRELGRAITVMDIGDLCPWGFPTEKVLRETWDSQKITPKPGTFADNWLDTAEAWRA